MADARYSEFASRIDVDAFEEAIGYEVTARKDDEDLGYCPDPWGMHKNGDSTGKFAIHRDKRVYNCWVCGGGTLLSLAMAFNDLDEQAAIDWLYQFTRYQDVTNDEFESEVEALLFKEQQEKPASPWFNERVLEKWLGPYDDLNPLYDWHLERGISIDVLNQHKVGFDPDHVRRSSKGDYMGPAIILPHFWGGRLVGWQSRWLEDSRPKWIPKYTNTHDFPRTATLYNYEPVYFADQAIVVAESVPTVLFLASLGVPAVATFGSSVTPEQMRLLRKCQQGIILAPDNDSAGRKCAATLTEYLERYIPVSVIEPIGEWDSGADLGDLASSPDAALERIRGATAWDIG